MLLECVRTGSSFLASHRDTNKIIAINGSPQSLVCESSGSTGNPKAIRRAPESWIGSFVVSQSIFDVSHYDHYAVLGSLGHSLGLFATMEALHIGAKLSILSSLSPRDQLIALQARKVSVLYATPTQLRQLQRVQKKFALDVADTVRTVFVGGGELANEDRDRMVLLFPMAKAIVFYGTSETSFITISFEDAPYESVGRAYPGVEIAIDGLDQGRSSGEIRVRSPYLALGFESSEDQEFIQSDGFVSTGDIGYVDRDGFLFILGRVDRMTTVADVNVFPEAIERVVAGLQGVEACAVVSRSDELRGNQTVCFVVASDDDFSSSALKRHCRDVLGDHHVPSVVQRTEKLPVLPSGKPDLQDLQRRAAAAS